MFKIIDKTDKDEIELVSCFVSLHYNSHFLQSPQWSEVKRLWEWRGIVIYDDTGKIAGVMSVLIRHLPLGLSLLYAPRGPVCDRNNKKIMTELFDGVKVIAKSCHALIFYMDPDEAYDNETFNRIMNESGFIEKSSDKFSNIQAQYVFRLNLKGRTEDEIFAAFSSKTRYNIRLAGRRNVEIKRFCGNEEIPEEALKEFSRLMNETGKRDHFVTRDKEYFKRIMLSFGENAVLFLAYLKGTPIAGTIGIFYGNKSWYLYGASSNEHRDAMPNYLLQWEMIKYAIKLNCFFYDLRGVPGNLSEDNPLYGLYRFKKGFSGEYIKFTGLFYYKFKRITGTIFLLLLKLYRSARRMWIEKNIK